MSKMYAKRALFITYSLFNLLECLQIKKKFEKDTECDIILAEGHKGFKQIYESGYLNEYFSNVYYIVGRGMTRYEKMICLFSPGMAYKHWIRGIKDVHIYTDVYFWNPDNLFYLLFMEYNHNKLPLNLHLYSDALTGWFMDSPDENAIDEQYRVYGRRILHKFSKVKYHFKCVNEMDYDFFMYRPELSMIKHNHNIIEVPLIDTNNKDYINYLNGLFSYNPNNVISEKYIFMDGGRASWENIEIHNALIRDFAKIVGRNNFIVKPHPLTDINEYDGCNVKIEQISYPWDLYCLNNSLEDKVLIAFDTSSCFLPAILYGQKPILISVKDVLTTKDGIGYSYGRWKHLIAVSNMETHELKKYTYDEISRLTELIEKGRGDLYD